MAPNYQDCRACSRGSGAALGPLLGSGLGGVRTALRLDEAWFGNVELMCKLMVVVVPGRNP